MPSKIENLFIFLNVFPICYLRIEDITYIWMKDTLYIENLHQQNLFLYFINSLRNLFWLDSSSREKL